MRTFIMVSSLMITDALSYKPDISMGILIMIAMISAMFLDVMETIQKNNRR